MDEPKVKISLSYTDEFGNKYDMSSEYTNYSDISDVSEVEELGIIFNNFLRQMTYPRSGDYICMESLTYDELCTVNDFIHEMRNARTEDEEENIG